MTTHVDDSCPNPAVLGAYIDGTLNESRVVDVTRHVTRCAECRTAVENVAEIEQENESAILRGEFGKRAAWLAVAAALLLFIAGISFFRTNDEPVARDSIARLVAASPKSTRTLEARLSGGFPWAPFRGTRRTSMTEKTPEELLASGEAGKVLQDLGSDTSPQSLHAKGVAYLVSGDAQSAVDFLTKATAGAEGNARVWSDLSAALYTMADGDAAVTKRSLEAADRAIRLNPRLAEGYFNRAVALEHIGTPQQSAAAWRDYIARFPDGEWSVEARERLARGGYG